MRVGIFQLMAGDIGFPIHRLSDGTVIVMRNEACDALCVRTFDSDKRAEALSSYKLSKEMGSKLNHARQGVHLKRVLEHGPFLRLDVLIAYLERNPAILKRDIQHQELISSLRQMIERGNVAPAPAANDDFHAIRVEYEQRMQAHHDKYVHDFVTNIAPAIEAKFVEDNRDEWKQDFIADHAAEWEKTYADTLKRKREILDAPPQFPPTDPEQIMQNIMHSYADPKKSK